MEKLEGNSNLENVTVRRATAADTETLLALIDALADYEKLNRPDQAARNRLTEHGFGAQPKFEVYLAEAGGQAIGYTITFETYSSFLALPTLYLEDLFVLPEYRKIGAGYALFSNCVKEAHRRGCGRMEWQVLDWNQLALDFYNRFGAQHMKEWYFYRFNQADLARLAQDMK